LACHHDGPLNPPIFSSKDLLEKIFPTPHVVGIIQGPSPGRRIPKWIHRQIVSTDHSNTFSVVSSFSSKDPHTN
jgi:hypothetical protein